MKRFDDVIEVGHLPTPKLIEELSVDLLLARQVDEYKRLWPEWSDETGYEPVRAHLGVDAYQENLIRTRINEAATASHLATSTGADLDIKGVARIVRRKLIQTSDPTATPPLEEIWESDDEYRWRIQIAPESWSVAGPEGAYVFWAMVPETSYDVTAVSPEPCDALITVMGRNNGGLASAEELDFVEAALDQKKVVPMCDRITVRSVEAVDFDWTGTLYVKRGADADVVLEAANEQAASYASYLKYIGRSAQPVGAYGALAVPGVERASHTLDDGLQIAPHQVINFTNISFEVEIVA